VRILYLADIRFPLERANGIQSMETCHALAARGHEVTLLVRPDTHEPPRDPYQFYGLPRLETLRIERAPVSGPASSRRAAYLAIATGRSAGPSRQDIIFTRDLGLASVLVRLPRHLRARLVYEAHGIAADTAAALPELLTAAATASALKLRRLARREERVWRGADAYVTITDGLAQELTRRFGPRAHVATIADGTHPLSEDAIPPLPSGPFTIGYAGHLYPWKGADLVVETIAALSDTRGLIIGGHPAEPDLACLKNMAARLGCSVRVTFTGLLPPDEARRRLREAHVLVLPNPASAISSAFTSPLKLFEYMMAGRPIVASDLPSIREVLTSDQNAVLVAPGDPRAVTAGVRRVKDDPALAERLARRAFEDARNYTWDRRAVRLETLFQQVAA
jgi:glycosyltransferase involved in cell wall biosynthesis